jgi:hypothetical protein
MAIETSLNILSESRLDVSAMRRLESGVRNDFDVMTSAIITNTTQGYIIRGFSIVTAGAIGSASSGLEVMVDPGAVLNIDASVSGTIFQTPLGTPNQILNGAINSNVSGSFTASSTNYVGIDYNRFADPTTDIVQYIWNATANDELPVIAPAGQTLTYKLVITTSVWAQNVLPIAIVTTDSNGNVTSITDSRWMLYSLETGGLAPNPNYVYPWTEGQTQSPVTTTSDSVNPFIGGDKQLDSLKAWMDAIMSEILGIKGTPFWFTGASINPPGPLPSIQSLFQDLGNTVITGPGEISNGILPNSDSILVTTGNITSTSNQLTALGSVVGLANGDYIFGTGIQAGTTILGISGSTITMSQPATLNGTGISVTFYSPSVITAPGQINWDQEIYIRVIGSSLTYTLAANPSSTDITLADDQVAYITLVREVPITPNLIFTTGSPVVNSVGAVTWTSGLLPGDLIKVASDSSSGYYVISTVNSGSQVTLTTNVLVADNTGATGAQAQYAFGSYSAAPTPSTNRNIYIANRADVPMNGNTFWLFIREDNGGAPRVYVRFLAQELDNGQSVNVSGTTSLELLQYIGAPSAASSSPEYVNALNPGSLTQITSITIGAGSTISAGQYFLIYSSNNARQYAVWFKVSGSGTAPVVPYFNSTIEVDISSSDSATLVASELATALNSVPFKDFSAVPGAGTVVVTNSSAGTSNAASNVDVGAPFAISITQSGTGLGNNVIHDGDSLTLAIKELDQAIGNIEASLNNPAYDETIEIVASGATPPSSLNGPIANSTVITLPLDSRTGNSLAQYTVGKGILQVFLNGQFIDIESGAYSEVGAAGTPSNQIEILTFPDGLVVGDELEVRFSGGAGGGSGAGVGPVGPAGAQGPRGFDALSGPVAISTKISDYTVTGSDCFLRGNCVSNSITFTLPLAALSTGNAFFFKKVDASINYLFVAASGSDLIDGFGTQYTNVQYDEFSVISNGTSWDIF